MKIRLIQFMFHFPILQKYAWRLYGRLLGNLFVDSINNAESVKKAELYSKFPELFVPMYILALMPAVYIYHYVSEFIGDKNWIKPLLKKNV